MPMLALAAATMTIDPSAAAVMDACIMQATASHKACDTNWRNIRLRMDSTLKGSVRVDDAGHGASWVTDCPYDIVHRSGGCALVSRGVTFIQPYKSDIPAIVWGDMNAERCERVLRFDTGRSASWTDRMSVDDTRDVLSLLEQNRRATFGWRPARAKVLASTTLDLTDFSDLRLLLAAMTQAAARAHGAA